MAKTLLELVTPEAEPVIAINVGMQDDVGMLGHDSGLPEVPLMPLDDGFPAIDAENGFENDMPGGADFLGPEFGLMSDGIDMIGRDEPMDLDGTPGAGM